MFDLHIHSTASDGQYTPTELVRMAKEKGVGLMAITDHDALGGVQEGQAAAAEAGIAFLPGIEISVKGAREMHILGYGIDVDAPEAAAMCTEFQRLRDERKYRILDYLRERNVELTLEQVERQAGSSLIARPHFARAMVEAGYVSTVREAFDRYLGTPEFDKVERPKPAPEAGIAMIHAIGGVAVLAHPSSLGLEEGPLEEQVKALIGWGLDGLECHYSKFTPEQSRFYLSLAKKYSLLVTGGSDFHGEKVKPDIALGGFEGNGLYRDGRELYEEIHARRRGKGK